MGEEGCASRVCKQLRCVIKTCDVSTKFEQGLRFKGLPNKATATSHCFFAQLKVQHCYQFNPNGYLTFPTNPLGFILISHCGKHYLVCSSLCI